MKAKYNGIDINSSKDVVTSSLLDVQEFAKKHTKTLDSAVFGYVQQMFKALEESGADPAKFELVWETQRNSLDSSYRIFVRQRDEIGE